MGGVSKLIGILEQLERSSFLRGFSSAGMPLFSKALPGDVLLFEALSVMGLPLAGPSHLLKASIAGYFRLLASHCVSSHPHHPLSHFISPNRIVSQRIARLGWQKDLTLQYEHDSWAGPPPDWPRQTSASPAESMSPRSLTY